MLHGNLKPINGSFVRFDFFFCTGRYIVFALDLFWLYSRTLSLQNALINSTCATCNLHQ